MLAFLQLRRAAFILITTTALVASATIARGAQAPVPETPAIVNGAAVSQAQFEQRWPFIVALVSPGKKSQFDGQFCGGSLIDDQHVVTAAHCVSDHDGVLINPRSVAVVANQRVLSRATAGSGEQRSRAVSDVFVHPMFGENSAEGMHWDIAVLRLAEPIANARTVSLVQAADAAAWGNGAGNVNGFVAGWGNTDPNGNGDPDKQFPAGLREVTVPIRSDARCSSTVLGGYGTAFERTTNLCAGVLEANTSKLGRDSCQGDSGGPLLVDVGGGAMRLAGITSWGDGCAQNFLGSYARVDALRSWVESIPGAITGDARLPIGGPDDLEPVTTPRQLRSDYTHVVLTWSAPAGGTAPERYSVWRRTGSKGDSEDTLAGITTGTTFTVSVPAAKHKRNDVFDVRAMDAAGNFGASTLVSGRPKVDRSRPRGPKALRVSHVAGGGATYHWSACSDPQSGVGAIQVLRRVVGHGGWKLIDTVGRTRRSYRDTDLRKGARIQVRVRAVDRAGNFGAWSPIATFHTRS